MCGILRAESVNENFFTVEGIQSKPAKTPSSLFEDNSCIPTHIPKIGFWLVITNSFNISLKLNISKF